MRLKFRVEVYVTTVKNDAKFEDDLTCKFKIDMKNLKIFDRSAQKSKKCPL